MMAIAFCRAATLTGSALKDGGNPLRTQLV
jgi:hypothetical protein